MVFLKRRKIRLKKRQQSETGIWKHILYGFLAIACVILLCAGMWYVARLPALTITTVTVEGGETLSHESVRHIVETELRGNYFLIIPHSFTYLYPRERIMAVLTSEPKVRSVVLEKSNRNELHVAFEEYVPHALWCLSLNEEECYFISKDGYAFAPAPALQGNAFLSHIFENEVELKEKQVIDAAELADIDAFSRVLQDELGFRAGQIVHTQAGDVIYRINGGGEFRTSRSMSAAETFENLKSVLDSDEFKHLRPGSFRYVDLRFGNKVFVNEALEQEESATSTDEKEEEPPEAALEQET